MNPVGPLKKTESLKYIIMYEHLLKILFDKCMVDPVRNSKSKKFWSKISNGVEV